jgi:hypothetical protein
MGDPEVNDGNTQTRVMLAEVRVRDQVRSGYAISAFSRRFIAYRMGPIGTNPTWVDPN